MAKQKFDIIQSTCIPIEIDNCNTDLIIPARYLASTTREPKFFGDAFMHDLRFDADGQPIADFVMNKEEYSESPKPGVHEIIIGGQNWGSGSSREHAAWAIAGYGVRVVISSSFADIHRNNLLNCFVLPVIVSRDFQQELFDTVKAIPTAEVKIDLPNQMVTNMHTGRSELFEINGYKKYCLMNALDDIDFLLENKDKIEQFGTLKEMNDFFLKDYEKTYEISKLSRQITDSMNKTINSKGKQELVNLNAEILEYQKQGKEMSDYDLQYLQKKYDLI